MPAPAPIPCSAPGCAYQTPENLPTYDLVTTHLQLHTNAAHPPPAPRGGGGPQPAHGQTAKVDKRSRPEASPDMSEHEFRFFQSEWNLYKRATNIQGQTLVDELWSCMSETLKKLVFDQGDVDSLNTEQLMMARIKSLAVAVLHTAIHTVHLHEARQIPEETTKAFAARARGIASNCILHKKCSCGEEVSYLEETVYHVVLAGLRDTTLQEACTTQALLGNIKDISSLVEFCTAKESGQMTAASTVGGLRSKYQDGKHRSQHGNQAAGSQASPAQQHCYHCGGKKHGNGSRAAREKDCKAYSSTCEKCEKKSHYTSLCKAKVTVAGVVSDNVDATNGAVTFGFYGVHSSWDFPPIKLLPHPSQAHSVHTQNRFSILSDLHEDISGVNQQPATPTPQRQHTSIKPTTTFTRRRSDKWSRKGHMKSSYRSAIPKTRPVPEHLIQALNTNSLHAGISGRVPLCHMTHDPASGWKEAAPMDSPTLQVHLTVHTSTYSALHLPLPMANPQHHKLPHKVSSVADSGAQMDILAKYDLEKMGLTHTSLFPVRAKANGASQGSTIDILGGIILKIKGAHAQSRSTLQLFYVASNVTRTYLSLSTLKALGVVEPDFPRIPIVNNTIAATTGIMKCVNDGVVQQGQTRCSCPPRTLAPSSPARLPCPATPDNIPKIKQYLMERYASSAYNCCENQPLPLMSGSPPLQLHVDPHAKPVAVHRPALVPLHWQDAVKKGLDRDIQLGVLERVPVNTPARWQSRMVVVAKHDGSPRRTVDYKNLNQNAPRQTHHTASPWQLVSTVPEGAYKSSFDCWHGYHSLPLAEEDRDLTSFITPWGRYRHLTCPQGVLSAGDAYTDRMDRIFEEFERIIRCIDDSLLWDNTIEEQFLRACQFLDKCSSHGIVLNPAKFTFCEQTMDFLGFSLTPTGVQPTEEFLNNILTFPTPSNTTDVRSWFGCVAQTSYSFATSPVMLAFRHLLSSKVPFSWSPELDTAFTASKQEVIRQCRDGVRKFDPTLPTCLATDWSKMGMGYWLTQKRCTCTTAMPGCCRTGWQTVFVGSRFCHQAEQLYAPIEGEAAAAAWAVEKCKFFLLGLPDFLLALDHKPLISIFGDKEIGYVTNPRLRNQKVKLLPYRFTPMHIAGKLNVVPDTLSRRSDSPIQSLPTTPDPNLLDISNVGEGYSNSLAPPTWVSGPAVVAPILVAALRVDMTDMEREEVEETEALIAGLAVKAIKDMYMERYNNYIVAAQTPIRVITWERLQEAASSSPIYQHLRKLISSGLPEDIAEWPETLRLYHPYRINLLVADDMILYGERPLIPLSLRDEVLDHLHGSHSGSTTMLSRAAQSVFWPNMTQEVTATRAHCTPCTRAAPSNPSMPPSPPVQPDFPFSHVCMDFFEVNGQTYLAMVDRYTAWLSVFCLAKDNSSNVIAALRQYFTRWGVCKQLTSDGASVFTSVAIKDFFYRWGVQHRVSSAYYPRANKRSEVAVKSAKRLIMENLGPKGQLDTDRFARALLLHRNSPDPLTGLSPAMILFGRELRDHLPAVLTKYQPRLEWRLEADLREKAHAKRHAKMEERLSFGAKPLPPLSLGDTVTVQDQSNPLKPGKWTKTGEVVEILPHNSYMIIIHGSRAPTQRNRRFLRKISPFHPIIPYQTEDHSFVPAPRVLRYEDTRVPGGPIPARVPDALPAATHEQAVDVPPPDTLPLAVRDHHDVTPHPVQSSPAPGPQAPAPSTPSAHTHRLLPAAPPGQDVVTLLRQREARGQVLGQHLPT